MSIFKALNDTDFIEDSTPVFRRSTWENEEVMPIKDRLLEEIELYDPCKSLGENFKSEFDRKYLLVQVGKSGNLSLNNRIPDQFSKIVVDISKMEEYSMPEFFAVDYDSLFGVRLTSFIKYNSDFFSCDERVFFEALLIKYKAFGHVPFFWSKEVIRKELGIKKDRVTSIINKFKEKGIITTEIRTSTKDGRPRKITYFDLCADNIMELIPKIFPDRDECGFVEELKKYLNFKENKNLKRVLL